MACSGAPIRGGETVAVRLVGDAGEATMKRARASLEREGFLVTDDLARARLIIDVADDGSELHIFVRAPGGTVASVQLTREALAGGDAVGPLVSRDANVRKWLRDEHPAKRWGTRRLLVLDLGEEVDPVPEALRRTVELRIRAAAASVAPDFEAPSRQEVDLLLADRGGAHGCLVFCPKEKHFWCLEECMREAGRAAGADLVVSGLLVSSEGHYTLKLYAIHPRTDRVETIFVGLAKSAEELPWRSQEAAELLLRRVGTLSPPP